MPSFFRFTSIIFTLLFITQTANADITFKRYKEHDRYDKYFSKYSKRFFGVGFDWQIFKAQAIAESHLDPEAQSHVGAQGLMQIMPRTYAEIVSKNKFIVGSATDPKSNISAGIYYDFKLWNFWTADRALNERLKFMFASYNAGAGNVLKAQRKTESTGNEGFYWQFVAQSLPDITGKHSKETLHYVDKIFIIHEDIN